MAPRTPHKAFADLERDIAAYYADRSRDLEVTALSVACRALQVARELLEPADVPAFERAAAAVVAQLGRRQDELYRGGGGQ